MCITPGLELEGWVPSPSKVAIQFLKTNQILDNWIVTSVAELTAYLSPYQDSRQYIKLLLLVLYLIESNYYRVFDK